MEILEMNLDDLGRIRESLIEEFDDFWTISVFENELKNENSKYIVAKESENIVGFAGVWFSPDSAEITNIVTKKTERKKGIGTKLLEKLIEIARENEKDNITLEVNENNVEAINLYKKFEFEIVGNRKKYYNGHDSAIIMTKFFKR